LRAAVKRQVEALAQRGIRRPPVLLAGDNPLARLRAQQGARLRGKPGCAPSSMSFPASVSEEALIDRLLALNDDPDVHASSCSCHLPKPVTRDPVMEPSRPPGRRRLHESNSATACGHARMSSRTRPA